MSMNVTRRGFSAGLTTLAAGLAAAPVARAAPADFRILTWEGYAEPEWVKPFEAANNVRTTIAYVGSVDEMFAKMQGSKGQDFDVVAYDTSTFKRYIDAKLVRPIDPAKVPNLQRLAPAFKDVPPIMRGDVRYGIPFAWGSLPLIYDKKAFPDGAPDSWNVFWDPKYAHQMIALDDANNWIVTAALAMGIKDPYNLTDAQFAAVKAKLIAAKKLLLTYYAGFDDGVNIFAQGGVKIMFSMGEPQVPALRKKGIDAAMVIPKEGAVGWLDCWTISAGAANPDLAHAWLNAVLAPGVGTILGDKDGYGNTVDQAENQKIGLTYADKLSFLQTPENFEKRVALWNAVKAAP
jgi:putative spermidine/putrescine transport system substrate-binding protein/spermidine/putrescine transport system substrate-binding protein